MERRRRGYDLGPTDRDFNRSIAEQIAINRAGTPTERFDALCELLDAARAMAPQDPESRERRARVMAARQRELDERHAEYRRLYIANHPDREPSVI